MKQGLKQSALQLRLQGWSYNVIAGRLAVSKGTLSAWLRAVPFTPNDEVVKRIRIGRATSAKARNSRKLESIRSADATAAMDLGQTGPRDLWFLGLGLYIGEGSKAFENVRISNSDPGVMAMGMRWFREICKIPDKNFRARIHLYPDSPADAAHEFWSSVTGIPTEQFDKVHIDRRQNKTAKNQSKLPFGTIHVSVRSLGDPEFGVLLHRRIMGWINHVIKTRV